MPIVNFCLSTTRHPIDENHSLWHCPLPINRLPANGATGPIDANAVTYGRYFSAIARFCADAGWNVVLRAAARKLAQPVLQKDLGRLTVFLEKHGAFYHPARIQVAIKDQTLCFVVNVAVSDHGRQALQREVRALTHLSRQRPFDWFPRIYGCSSTEPPMFLGDWFDNFHEFHLTRRPDSADLAMVVWDGAVAPVLLTDKQVANLYRNATMILAACYEPITACQIFPWHHAAGDFVVKVEGERVTVKLITVRDYVPLSGLAAEPEDERALLDTLLLFFIHLSVCMRLDRIDGVGAVAWAPDHCLVPMLDGFFQGLDLTARMSGFPELFSEIVREYFNRHALPDLLALAKRVTAAVFNARSEEYRVVDSHLLHHISGICRILSAG
ncbi:hypothetical protein [Desulfosarcina sp.]|uniref:hypothetical protein n=1 Tax=Desulfosarcina sp. TaxID=2027861 RepID=UPI0039709577